MHTYTHSDTESRRTLRACDSRVRVWSSRVRRPMPLCQPVTDVLITSFAAKRRHVVVELIQYIIIILNAIRLHGCMYETFLKLFLP